MTLPEQLKDKIRTISNLPTLPQVATSILKEISNTENSVEKLADLLRKDLAITAKILKLANSAYYGVPRKISNIQEAVVLLGTETIATLVLTITVFDFFPDEFSDPGFNKETFWKHSIATAVIAQSIGNLMKAKAGVNSDDLFAAGLLHDIGKIVMEQYLHQDMLKSIMMFKSSPDITTIFGAEEQVLGYTHCDVASWLLSKWNFPDRLLDPIIHHHKPYKSEHSGNRIQILIVALANELSHNYFIPYTTDKIAVDEYLIDKFSKDAGITPRTIDKLRRDLQETLADSVDNIMALFNKK